MFRDNNYDIWIYDLEREISTRLTFHDGYDADIWAESFSSDGEWLAVEM